MTSNGSVTVKSLSGGTYTATQNPSGAVTRSSQNAATQPATVIIQATSSASAQQCYGKGAAGGTIAAAAVTCGTGYTKVFEYSGNGNVYDATPISNIGSTNWHLIFPSVYTGPAESSCASPYGYPNGRPTLINPEMRYERIYSATYYPPVYPVVCPNATDSYWSVALCCKS